MRAHIGGPMEPGSLLLDDGTVLPPDPAELTLRPMYAPLDDGGVRLSLIQSSDGSAVGQDGSSRSLNGPEDLRILRVTRSWADVVIVGARTARAEAYGDLRLRPEILAQRRSGPPDLAIVTRSGDVPAGLDPQRTWIVTTASAPAAHIAGPLGRRLIVAGNDGFDPAAMVGHLRALGYRNLLCEGGPELAAALVDAQLVTDYCLTTSPLPSGNGPTVPPVPEGLHLKHRLTGAGYVMERWQR